MGGAQPLAATMAGASCLAVECDSSRIDFRLRTKYLDERAETLDEALEILKRAKTENRPVSVGSSVMPRKCLRKCSNAEYVRIWSQTKLQHTILCMAIYLSAGQSDEWRSQQKSNPKKIEKAARASIKIHVEAMLDFWNQGIPTVDYGNNIRQFAFRRRC